MSHRFCTYVDTGNLPTLRIGAEKPIFITPPHHAVHQDRSLKNRMIISNGKCRRIGNHFILVALFKLGFYQFMQVSSIYGYDDSFIHLLVAVSGNLRGLFWSFIDYPPQSASKKGLTLAFKHAYKARDGHQIELGGVVITT